MKKAQVVLTSLAIVAVVGAAFAFKAKSFGPNVLYTKNSAGVCNKVAPVTTPGAKSAANATIIADAGATTDAAICTHSLTYNLE